MPTAASKYLERATLELYKVVMSKALFSAFYTTPPIWVCEDPDLRPPESGEPVDEVVYSVDKETHAIRICRDGMHILHIAEMDRVDPIDLNSAKPKKIDGEKDAREWAKTVEIANAYNLILNSSIKEKCNTNCLMTREITMRDIRRLVSIEECLDDPSGCIAKLRSKCVKDKPAIKASFSAISYAEQLFERALKEPALCQQLARLARLAKSISECEAGNDQISLIIAWFAIEVEINRLWSSKIMKSDRVKDISGRCKKLENKNSYTASVKLEVLDFSGNIDHDLYKK